MVVWSHVLVNLTIIDVTIKVLIGIGLLKNNITGIFLIGKDSSNGSSGPFAVFLGRNTICIQFISNSLSSFAGKDISKYPFYNFSLLWIDDYVLAIPIVAVRCIAELEGSVLEAAFNGPLGVF